MIILGRFLNLVKLENMLCLRMTHFTCRFEKPALSCMLVHVSSLHDIQRVSSIQNVQYVQYRVLAVKRMCNMGFAVP